MSTETLIPFGVDPDTEAWLPLPGGGVFAFPSTEAAEDGCQYVRVLDPHGGEVAYWDADEWAEDPAYVMGAICGSMLAVDTKADPEKYYQFGPNTSFPPGVDFTPYSWEG